VFFELTPSERIDVRATVRTDKQWCVLPSRTLLDELEELCEQENILLVPKPNGNGSAPPRRRYRNNGAYRSTEDRLASPSPVTGPE
jgi:hypothetical protein